MIDEVVTVVVCRAIKLDKTVWHTLTSYCSSSNSGRMQRSIISQLSFGPHA